MSVQTTYATALTVGIEGQLHDDAPHVAIPAYNDEASASIPFGHAVKYGADTADNEGMLLPAAESDAIVGIVLHHHGYAAEDLDATGVIAGASLSVLRKGRVTVACESGCTRGDPLWVRAVAGGGEFLGACENADDSTDMIDCSNQGRWMTTAAAGALAVLEVDFTSSPTVA